jgi:hypothetical protein
MSRPCLPLFRCRALLQVFDRFDVDGSGRISTAELLDLVGKHGPGFTSELDEEVRGLLLFVFFGELGLACSAWLAQPGLLGLWV